MHPSWPPRATLPSTGELPGWRDLGCIRASMPPRVTAMHKHPEVHAVHGTRDSSHSCSGRMCENPRWHTAESTALSPSSLWKSFNWPELPCLNGAGKTKWPPHDLARGGLSSPRNLTRGELSSPRNLARGGLSSPRNLNILPDMVWTDLGQECSSACWHIALGTPSE